MSIKITQVRNAVSIEADNSRMNVEINHPVFGWIPYTLDPTDTDTTINNDEVMALIGDNFEAYVAPSQEELYAQASTEVREFRNYLLVSEVDPLVTNPLRWADLTAAKQTAWAQYRTDLLNITDQASFPHNVTWPTKPE